MIPDFMPEGVSPAEWALSGLFILAVSIQFYYYLGVYTRLIRFQDPEPVRRRRGVSVIICARNAAHHLERFLPRVLDQDYPEFEVVVVNDGSTDHTEEVLASLTVQDPRLRYTSIPPNQKYRPGKKLALTIGIKSARFDFVLVTDADCYPSGREWLKRMTSPLDDQTELVLGYGRYSANRGWLNRLIRYDTFFTAIQYFSFALKGRPYMGVGRNLAYRKSLFTGGAGFSRHYHIASGDDDLFVNEHATGTNTAVVTVPESHTVSVPKKTTGSWIRQKQRHLTAGNLYRPGSRIRIALELISRLLLYASLVLLVSTTPLGWHAVALFLPFLVTRLVILKLGMKRLSETDLLLPSLLFDPVLPLILGAIWFSNIFVTKYQPWN